MWREMPSDTYSWSEEDWEQYFHEQDEWFFSEMQRLMTSEDETPDTTGHVDSDDEEHSSRDGVCATDNCQDCACHQEPEEEEVEHEADEGDMNLGRELRDISAWMAAVEFSNSVFEVVKPLCKKNKGGPLDYIVRKLCQESVLVPDYIAAGHEMGYDEDTLCGNIALCTRSLRSLNICVQCLDRLGGSSDRECNRLLVRAMVTKTMLERCIVNLRERVWWR
jgi:hypothetical protein